MRFFTFSHFQREELTFMLDIRSAKQSQTKPNKSWHHLSAEFKDKIDIDLYAAGIRANKQAAKNVEAFLNNRTQAIYSPQQNIWRFMKAVGCCSRHWVNVESVFAREKSIW